MEFGVRRVDFESYISDWYIYALVSKLTFVILIFFISLFAQSNDTSYKVIVRIKYDV